MLFAEILFPNIQLTAEEENFVKINKILLDIIPRYLRELFVGHWDIKYPNHKWWSDSSSVDMLLSGFPKGSHFIDFVRKMKTEDIEKWGTAALIFAFMNCGHRLVEVCRPYDSRVPRLCLCKELGIIRRIHSDFCRGPCSTQCPSGAFTEAASQIKFVARNIFGFYAEHEIDEIIQSQVATEKTIEQLEQQLRKEKIPDDELKNLVRGRVLLPHCRTRLA